MAIEYTNDEWMLTGPRIRNTNPKFKIAPIDGEGDINHGRHQQT